MKLKSITVGGFKNVEKTKLLTNGIIAIVSPNNYGKSNLLEAIDFGFDFIFAGSRDRHRMMSWKSGIPINKSLENDAFYFEIEFLDESLGIYRFVRYGFSFLWYKDDGSGQIIIDEWLDARSNESVGYTSYIKRNKGKYRKEKDTSYFRSVAVDSNQLIIELLATIHGAPIQKVASSIKKISYQVCASLDVRSRFQASPIEFADAESENGVAFDDEDVPRAIYRLSKLDPDKFDMFLESIYSIFPEFSEVKVQSYEIKKTNLIIESVSEASDKQDLVPFRIKDEIYRVIITSNYLNQQMDISRMSTGTKRVFWLLINVFIASIKGIGCIGIEELETSIHPKLLKNLLESIYDVIDNTSIIVSSHSPYLIQYFKPENLYIGMPNEKGTAVFKRIRPSSVRGLVNIARDNGMSIGEYLFNLMSGDKDSRDILSFYLEGIR